MKEKSSLVDYYARRAQEYERIYHKPERQEDLARLREMVASAFTGKRVLEVACGTGYWTEVLGRAANSVTATDINEEVLEIARRKADCNGKVTFQRADSYRLPAFQPKFSAGLGAFWWSHVPKARLKEFLKGFHEAFEPQATLMFMDNRYVEGSSTPISRKDVEGNTYQWRKLDDGSVHEVLKNFPGREELLEHARASAAEVEVTELKYFWVLNYKLSKGAP
jgi:demethylmenaquinone methyltransferase/2-methoxy-6-polyprenyl-1,4-benzoquinol methylase